VIEVDSIIVAVDHRMIAAQPLLNSDARRGLQPMPEASRAFWAEAVRFTATVTSIDIAHYRRIPKPVLIAPVRGAPPRRRRAEAMVPGAGTTFTEWSDSYSVDSGGQHPIWS
jgi:hypothetical protein